MKLKRTIWIVLCPILLTVMACKKTTTPTSAATNQISPSFSTEEIKQQRLAWNLKTLVEPYEHVGHTNPKWDGPATLALNEFARSRAGATDKDEPVAEIISINIAAAVQAGCDDPLVDYLFIRYAMNQTNSPKSFSDAFNDAQSGIQKSGYPSIRKFYVSLRAVQQYNSAYGYGSNVDFTKPKQLILDARKDLVDSLNDKTMPLEEVYEACSQLLYSWPGDMNSFKDTYAQIEKPLFANWPDEAISWLLKGEAYNLAGAIARGNGYANTVTPEGWKGLAENSAIAEKALQHAWELDPKNERIAVTMIWVELGLNRGRDEMDLWFNRAMEDDPNDYDACSAKLNYVQPKWGGSVQDMLDFGHECVRNPNWGGNVPLILADVHDAIQSQYIDDSEKTNYWKQADVWPDIKSSFDRFFLINSNTVSWRHNYALYAYKCGQWDEFLHQITLFSSGTNYSYFGGKEAFDNMVRLANENTGK